MMLRIDGTDDDAECRKWATKLGKWVRVESGSARVSEWQGRTTYEEFGFEHSLRSSTNFKGKDAKSTSRFCSVLRLWKSSSLISRWQ